MLDATAKRRLKKEAHALKPLVRIGRNGVTEGAIRNIDRALGDHELVKIRFLDYKEQRKELSEKIAEETRSAVVDLIGNTLVLYRESPDPKKRKTRR